MSNSNSSSLSSSPSLSVGKEGEGTGAFVLPPAQREREMGGNRYLYDRREADLSTLSIDASAERAREEAEDASMLREIDRQYGASWREGEADDSLQRGTEEEEDDEKEGDLMSSRHEGGEEGEEDLHAQAEERRTMSPQSGRVSPIFRNFEEEEGEGTPIAGSQRNKGKTDRSEQMRNHSSRDDEEDLDEKGREEEDEGQYRSEQFHEEEEEAPPLIAPQAELPGAPVDVLGMGMGMPDKGGRVSAQKVRAQREADAYRSMPFKREGRGNRRKGQGHRTRLNSSSNSPQMHTNVWSSNMHSKKGGRYVTRRSCSSSLVNSSPPASNQIAQSNYSIPASILAASAQPTQSFSNNEISSKGGGRKKSHLKNRSRSHHRSPSLAHSRVSLHKSSPPPRYPTKALSPRSQSRDPSNSPERPPQQPPPATPSPMGTPRPFEDPDQHREDAIFQKIHGGKIRQPVILQRGSQQEDSQRERGLMKGRERDREGMRVPSQRRREREREKGSGSRRRRSRSSSLSFSAGGGAKSVPSSVQQLSKQKRRPSHDSITARPPRHISELHAAPSPPSSSVLQTTEENPSTKTAEQYETEQLQKRNENLRPNPNASSASATSLLGRSPSLTLSKENVTAWVAAAEQQVRARAWEHKTATGEPGSAPQHTGESRSVRRSSGIGTVFGGASTNRIGGKPPSGIKRGTSAAPAGPVNNISSRRPSGSGGGVDLNRFGQKNQVEKRRLSSQGAAGPVISLSDRAMPPSSSQILLVPGEGRGKKEKEIGSSLSESRRESFVFSTKVALGAPGEDPTGARRRLAEWNRALSGGRDNQRSKPVKVERQNTKAAGSPSKTTGKEGDTQRERESPSKKTEQSAAEKAVRAAAEGDTEETEEKDGKKKTPRKKILHHRPSLIMRVRPENAMQVRSEFFESGCTSNPRLKYRQSDAAVAKDFAKFSEVDETLLAEATAILELTKMRFGSCQNYLSYLYGTDLCEPEELKALALAYCQTLGPALASQIDVKLSSCLLSVANVSKPAPDSPYFLHLLSAPVCRGLVEPICNHEVGTHFLRMLNNERQPWHGRRHKYGLRPHLATEEGLATLNSLLSLPHCPLLWSPALRYYATCMANRLSFADTFKELERFVEEPGRRFRLCMRAKRGMTDTSQPGAINLDQAYLQGAIGILRNVHSIDFPLLYSGQVDFRDLDRVSLGGVGGWEQGMETLTNVISELCRQEAPSLLSVFFSDSLVNRCRIDVPFGKEMSFSSSTVIRLQVKRIARVDLCHLPPFLETPQKMIAYRHMLSRIAEVNGLTVAPPRPSVLGRSSSLPPSPSPSRMGSAEWGKAAIRVRNNRGGEGGPLSGESVVFTAGRLKAALRPKKTTGTFDGAQSAQSNTEGQEGTAEKKRLTFYKWSFAEAPVPVPETGASGVSGSPGRPLNASVVGGMSDEIDVDGDLNAPETGDAGENCCGPSDVEGDEGTDEEEGESSPKNGAAVSPPRVSPNRRKRRDSNASRQRKRAEYEEREAIEKKKRDEEQRRHREYWSPLHPSAYKMPPTPTKAKEKDPNQPKDLSLSDPTHQHPKPTDSTSAAPHDDSMMRPSSRWQRRKPERPLPPTSPVPNPHRSNTNPTLNQSQSDSVNTSEVPKGTESQAALLEIDTNKRKEEPAASKRALTPKRTFSKLRPASPAATAVSGRGRGPVSSTALDSSGHSSIGRARTPRRESVRELTNHRARKNTDKETNEVSENEIQHAETHERKPEDEEATPTAGASKPPIHPQPLQRNSVKAHTPANSAPQANAQPKRTPRKLSRPPVPVAGFPAAVKKEDSARQTEQEGHRNTHSSAVGSKQKLKKVLSASDTLAFSPNTIILPKEHRANRPDSPRQRLVLSPNLNPNPSSSKDQMASTVGDLGQRQASELNLLEPFTQDTVYVGVLESLRLPPVAPATVPAKLAHSPVRSPNRSPSPLASGQSPQQKVQTEKGRPASALAAPVSAVHNQL
uniref:Uncharacterized protein n=1 Tax=Chromera velia CCMP2878 TaxID=1169474 RepID=A0A0G4GA53_9ALVE|eukprot:Cvel_20841.t1-p1 / transcript=Cvel_20841.t1 / gene=Cvel_20841 / organism=Chromera_velia_CCMP2878 / gene_product=Uncharacterized protein KIAA0895-like, putative / transcript_product=Uncharacterized protein KIAA0895-like, putative / location=Cvel_scaffold1907:22067-29594(+) / protein_length=1972 / sequence_SO=supercontig / SO=protein_coding / is_pseudo=false